MISCSGHDRGRRFARWFQATAGLACLIMATAHLSCIPSSPPKIPYEPCVTFTGYFKKYHIELPGNPDNPNTCVLVGDTIRMFFYSDDYFDDGPIWKGDRLRIDVYPFDPETLPNNLAGIKQLFVRLSRYHDANETYLVGVMDTAYNNVCSAQMAIESCARRRGGAILFTQVQARMHQENSSTPAFTIEHGEIRGNIE